MKQIPLNHIKRGRGRPLRQVPAEGSALRELYDLFYANRGRVIEWKYNCKAAGRTIDDLRDYYGMDIRRIRNSRWILAGEWFGRVYIDYVAERIEAGKNSVDSINLGLETR